jgi:hypothetical protein
MFSYDLYLGFSIHHWKGLTEKNFFFTSPGQCLPKLNRPQIPKKCQLGPQNDPGSLELEKLSKNCQDGKLFFEPME